MLCGVDEDGYGTYTTEGIAALSEALKVTASLTRMDVRFNSVGDEGKNMLRKAVEERSGFELNL